MTSEAGDQSTRWRLLLDELAAHRQLSVTQAAALLNVSAATVRRDFKELARQQLATRTHGGVVATSVAYELPARYRVSSSDPRQRIAEAAAAQVQVGDVIGFNGGTTTSAVARHVGLRPDLKDVGGEALTVVTNALNIAAELVLRPYVRTVCLGGVARPESYELHGPFASRVLRDLSMHHLFLGVGGLTATEGATCQHLGESTINAEMVASAQRVTLVAASTKLGRVELARICTLERIDAVITDTDADPEVVAAIEAAGASVTLV